MCTVLLPPGAKATAVNKYITSINVTEVRQFPQTLRATVPRTIHPSRLAALNLLHHPHDRSMECYQISDDKHTHSHFRGKISSFRNLRRSLTQDKMV